MTADSINNVKSRKLFSQSVNNSSVTINRLYAVEKKNIPTICCMTDAVKQQTHSTYTEAKKKT